MSTRRFLAATVVVLCGAWGCAWWVASDRAELALREARNQALREEIESNRRYCERRAALEARRDAFESVMPAYCRILPVREEATDEKLLRDIQSLSETAGIRILEVRIEVKS